MLSPPSPPVQPGECLPPKHSSPPPVTLALLPGRDLAKGLSRRAAEIRPGIEESDSGVGVTSSLSGVDYKTDAALRLPFQGLPKTSPHGVSEDRGYTLRRTGDDRLRDPPPTHTPIRWQLPKSSSAIKNPLGA